MEMHFVKGKEGDFVVISCYFWMGKKIRDKLIFIQIVVGL